MSDRLFDLAEHLWLHSPTVRWLAKSAVIASVAIWIAYITDAVVR